MTRDELLKEIDFELGLSDYDTWREGAKALRAVVELHKPDVQGRCDICTWITRGGGVMYEACPTIQAIEKELK